MLEKPICGKLKSEELVKEEELLLGEGEKPVHIEDDAERWNVKKKQTNVHE